MKWLIISACIIVLGGCKKFADRANEDFAKNSDFMWNVGVPESNVDLTWTLGAKYLIRGVQEVRSGESSTLKGFSTRWGGTLTVMGCGELILKMLGKPDDAKIPPLRIDARGPIPSGNITVSNDWLRAYLATDVLFILTSPACEIGFGGSKFVDITELLGEQWQGACIYSPIGTQNNSQKKTCRLVRIFASVTRGGVQSYHLDGIIWVDIKTKVMRNVQMYVYSISGTSIDFNGKTHYEYIMYSRKWMIDLVEGGSGSVKGSNEIR